MDTIIDAVKKNVGQKCFYHQESQKVHIGFRGMANQTIVEAFGDRFILKNDVTNVRTVIYFNQTEIVLASDIGQTIDYHDTEAVDKSFESVIANTRKVLMEGVVSLPKINPDTYYLCSYPGVKFLLETQQGKDCKLTNRILNIGYEKDNYFKIITNSKTGMMLRSVYNRDIKINIGAINKVRFSASAIQTGQLYVDTFNNEILKQLSVIVDKIEIYVNKKSAEKASITNSSFKATSDRRVSKVNREAIEYMKNVGRNGESKYNK